ncbi:HNHc domain-containing protein [Fusarium sp. LHS14.1]|nr:HNHc domain-containing protein [Fusarium sp. LHS14.1]
MPLNVRRAFSDVSRCGDENAIESPNAIRFFHPGYGKTSISNNAHPPIRDALVSLPAFDDGGIHYDTAHTTCGVLAGNRWDGYFSLDREGTVRVPPPVDGILRERAYFFCLPPSSDSSTSTDPYPIVASFRDWRFPHSNLPPCWERLRPHFRGGAPGSVRRCILTDCGLSLDAAHLVPVKETSWYDDNGMLDYGKAPSFSTDAVNASTNIITLRTDVHRMFDERNFCFAPKSDHRDGRPLMIRNRGSGDSIACRDSSSNESLETDKHQPEAQDEASRTEQQSKADSAATSKTQEDYLVVGHVFNSIPGGELQKLWHNREAYPGLYAASLDCLFARFAWTVFSPNVFRDFLHMTKEPRFLLVWDEYSGQYGIEKAEPAKCKLTLKAARARSESPTKRQRPASDAGQDEDNWDEGLGEPRDNYKAASSDNDSGYHGELYHYEADDLGVDIQSPEEEPERGRTRKRKHLESYSGAFEAGDENKGTKRASVRRV